MSLSGTKTEQNLKDAFAGESQANRRYLFFAQKADVEGYNDVSAVFRSTAEGETGHAFGHLEFLTETGDPATGEPIGTTANNLKARLRERPMNIQICTRGWPRPHATRVLTKLLIGLRLLRRPRNLMPDVSRRHSILLAEMLLSIRSYAGHRGCR